jgi:hypothetical protein
MPNEVMEINCTDRYFNFYYYANTQEQHHLKGFVIDRTKLYEIRVVI